MSFKEAPKEDFSHSRSLLVQKVGHCDCCCTPLQNCRIPPSAPLVEIPDGWAGLLPSLDDEEAHVRILKLPKDVNWDKIEECKASPWKHSPSFEVSDFYKRLRALSALMEYERGQGNPLGLISFSLSPAGFGEGGGN